MKTKNFIQLLFAVILIGGAIEGAFFGGEVLGRKNAATTQSQTAQVRTAQSGVAGQAPVGTNGTRQQGAPQFAGGNGVAGVGPNATSQNGTPQPGGVQQGGRIGGAGLIGGGGLATGPGGAAIGTVQSVSGDTITLTTQNGSSIKVILSSNTTVQKLTLWNGNDIGVGSNITVGGQRNADGSVQAATILFNQIATR